MNQLMHEAINKFNNINIMCGSFVLELESDNALRSCHSSLKGKLEKLLDSIGEDFNRSRIILAEIVHITNERLSSSAEAQALINKINPLIFAIEEKTLKLKGAVAGDNPSSAANDIIRLLHDVEEAAFGAAMVLTDLRGLFIKFGMYKT